MGADVSVGLHGLGADGGFGCGVVLRLHGFAGRSGEHSLAVDANKRAHGRKRNEKKRVNFQNL